LSGAEKNFPGRLAPGSLSPHASKWIRDQSWTLAAVPWTQASRPGARLRELRTRLRELWAWLRDLWAWLRDLGVELGERRRRGIQKEEECERGR